MKPLISSIKDNMRKLKGSPQHIWESIQMFLKNISMARVIITILLIVWLIGITFLIVWNWNTKKEVEVVDDCNSYRGDCIDYNTKGYSYSNCYKNEGVVEEVEDVEKGGFLNDEENHVRYFNLHRVWFGEESIVMILFKLWYYAALLWMLSPILKELVVFLKMRVLI
jgi:hypothetical protein